MQDYTEDLQYLADNVTDALNIFAAVKIEDNQMIVAFTAKDYIAIQMVPQEDNDLATLKLKTRDMSASWRNVPVGFSKINESQGLFNDMRRAAHPSLKRNCLWFIGYQIKNSIGDRIRIAEVMSYKTFKYRIELSNQYKCVIQLTKDEKEYRNPHDLAKIFMICDEAGNPLIDSYLTTDECLMNLVNMAMMQDQRAAKFVQDITNMGGKAKVTHSYRLPEESIDEIRAMFSNKYAVQIKITNKQYIIKLFTRDSNTMIPVDERKFDKMDMAMAYLQNISAQSAS